MIVDHENQYAGGLYQINAPHFCAGVLTDGARVIVEAAPILKYMRGWPLEQAQDYCAKKGWKLTTYMEPVILTK